VYKAVNTVPPFEEVAIKRLHGTFCPARVAKEITFLKKLDGRHHVVPLVAGFRFEDNISLVFPYFHHQSYRNYYILMEEDEIREYMQVRDSRGGCLNFFRLCLLR
jgi:cell division control protein 7